MNISGEIIELWRYPVKSMLGECCQEIELEARGVVGDRLFAVQDANGKLGSGKDTRRFQKIDGLFSLQAHLLGILPQIKFPDGTLLSGDDPAIDAALSDVLGQAVQLVRETEISHLDAGPVHIITHASLARLQSVAPASLLDARRFRPNIVLSTEDYPVEHAWLGKHVRIGQAELRFSSATQRCAMVTFAQSELPHDPQLLRHVTQEFDMLFGHYAQVIKPGLIRLGDRITEI